MTLRVFVVGTAFAYHRCDRDNRAYNRVVKQVLQTQFEYRIRPRVRTHALPSQSRPSLFGSD